MKYFKISCPPDDLAYYVAAPSDGVALKAVEDLVGPLPPQRRRINEVARNQIPEGTTIWGDPESGTED